MSETLERLTDVFQDVFDDDDIALTESTTAADIPDWDSMMHVVLMLKVEAAFGVRFNSSDVTGLKTVGELAALIDARSAT